MTEVNPEARQKAKTEAANLAVAANDVAVALGAIAPLVAIAGVASGVGSLAGVGVGAGLAIASFGAWCLGNRYQRLANDPPRDDFDVVTIAAAATSLPGQSSTDAEVSAKSFAAYQFLLADALDCLVTSLERLDGANVAQQADAINAQVDAVHQNAQAARTSIAVLVDCAAALNQAWAATDGDWTVLSLDQIKSTYIESSGPPHQAPGAPLRALIDTISGLATDLDFASLDPDRDPILTLVDKPDRPVELIGSNTINMMQELSAICDALVVENVA